MPEGTGLYKLIDRGRYSITFSGEISQQALPDTDVSTLINAKSIQGLQFRNIEGKKWKKSDSETGWGSTTLYDANSIINDLREAVAQLKEDGKRSTMVHPDLVDVVKVKDSWANDVPSFHISKIAPGTLFRNGRLYNKPAKRKKAKPMAADDTLLRELCIHIIREKYPVIEVQGIRKKNRDLGKILEFCRALMTWKDIQAFIEERRSYYNERLEETVTSKDYYEKKLGEYSPASIRWVKMLWDQHKRLAKVGEQ